VFLASIFLLATINHEITAQTGKAGEHGSADGPESSKTSTGWQALVVAVIAAAGALGGSAFGQRITA
jgi:hypothetical protein